MRTPYIAHLPLVLFLLPRLGKYLTKNFAEHKMNEKRYWTSRGITVPERHPIDHILGDDAPRAIVLASEAAQ
uniref:Uncharacterized protein n=1 Tax=Pandoraea faecigallinarum TaxID=656179 RepID=A0A173GZW7_9BURK